mgnify:CR=1 FL=1
MINGKEKPDALPLLINRVRPVNVRLSIKLRTFMQGLAVSSASKAGFRVRECDLLGQIHLPRHWPLPSA